MSSVQFKIKKKHLEVLQQLADKRKASIQEVLQHCISTEAHFDQALDDGCQVLIEKPTGELLKVVFAHQRKMGSE